MRIVSVLTSAFSLWVLVASALALMRPTLFTWFSGPLITIGLGVIMLSMGMTLGFADFRRVARERGRVLPVSIEVGMQNSGLGVVLAQQNFASPLVAIPSAISSVFHSLVGSLVAAWWRRSARK